MRINDIDIKSYNATLLNVETENCEIENMGEFWAENSITPFPQRQKTKWSRVEAEMLIEAANDDEAEKMVSKIISLSKSAELEFSNRTLIYKGTLDKTQKENVTSGNITLTMEWQCQIPYEKGTQQVTFNQTTTIELDSTEDTPCIVEIMPIEDIETATITGLGEDITISNLTEGAEVVIDGEKGIVTEDGANKFLDYDSWGFPVLGVGENIITVDTDKLNITIKYNPLWG